jgi:phage protein D/phage baseplate assembly protein gpV
MAAAGLGELTIEIAGSALGAEEAACLGGLRVRQALSVPAQCELAFEGIAESFGDRAPLLAGLTLAVRTEHDTLFSGEITAVEHGYAPDGGREVRLRAYDALHRLRKRQSVEFRNDVDAGELCRQFAPDLGVDADVSEAGPRWPRLAQWHQTDFDLLADTAGRAGLHFAVWDNTLRLFSLAGVGDPVSLRLGDDLLEASFELNGDRAWSEVAATGWDPATGDRFQGSADSGRSGRSAYARVSTTDVGGDPRRMLVNAAVPGSEHVEAAAQGELDRATANALTVRGVAAGNAELRAGCKVSLDGMQKTLAGTYVVTEVTHTMDADRGFVSTFSTEVPAPRRPAAAAVVAPGVVNRVDDPEEQGRVTVKLPGYHNVETGWMRVLLPGAGKSKGFVALPDEGDEVLVLFPEGDPAVGIVLGGLFGKDDVPDTGIAGGRVRRLSWRSPKGHYLEIDDQEERMTIAHANGSTIQIAKDKLSIETVTDLEIKAPGRSIAITAAAVDFKKG